jgi:hypothetical protein
MSPSRDASYPIVKRTTSNNSFTVAGIANAPAEAVFAFLNNPADHPSVISSIEVSSPHPGCKQGFTSMSIQALVWIVSCLKKHVSLTGALLLQEIIQHEKREDAATGMQEVLYSMKARIESWPM